MNRQKINKTVFEVAGLHDSNDSSFWLQKTPFERIEAIEFMRKVMFGSDRVSERLQRVLTIVELKKN